MIRRLSEVRLGGSRVLLRADLNVPLGEGAISDDFRIRRAIPSIERLAAAGNRVIVAAHLGRPAGAEPAWSLAQLVTVLSGALGRPVAFGDRNGSPGEVCLLENMRFDPRETSDVPEERARLAAELADLADVVVNDAFASAHRAHASTLELCLMRPSYAGLLLEAELGQLRAIVDGGRRPMVVIVGGVRMGEKLPLLARIVRRADATLLGAQMAAELLRAARGEGEAAATARAVLHAASLVVPADVIVEEAGRRRAVPLRTVGSRCAVVDLGPRALEDYRARVAEAGSVVWNGPPGLQHLPGGDAGALALARACAAGDAVCLAGGGTTIVPFRRLGLVDRLAHVSTGGTVVLTAVAGLRLPAVEALEAS